MKYLLIIFFYYNTVFAQKIIKFHITKEDSLVLKNSKIRIPDIVSFQNKSNITIFLSQLKDNSFSFASIDSIEAINDTIFYSLFLGSKSNSIHIADRNDLKLNNFRELDEYLDNNIKVLNDSFYLLANLTIDSLNYNNNNYLFSISQHKGSKFTIDSIILKATSKDINYEFINSILFHSLHNLKSSSIALIESKLKEISFIEVLETPKIYIKDTSAFIQINLKERKSNQFNAFLGLLSNQNSNLSLTGDVSLSLKNLFYRGIDFSLNWQKPQTESQFLFLNASIPYLLNTPFGSTFAFSIEKMDTSFIRIAFELGINYRFSYSNFINFIFKRQASTISSLDYTSLTNNKLPRVLDYTYNQIGFQHKFSKIDKPLFTRKGFLIDYTLNVGTKSIHKNDLIVETLDNNGVSYGRLYDSVKLSSFVFNLSLTMENYLLLSKRITIKSTILSKILNSSNVSTNEMYIFGGVRKPRGFNDNSLISPLYAIISNDVEYFINANFFANLFLDYTIMKDITIPSFSLKYPVGFGTGISLMTKGGIVNVAVGFGTIGTSVDLLKSSKIHFGYVSTF